MSATNSTSFATNLQVDEVAVFDPDANAYSQAYQLIIQAQRMIKEASPQWRKQDRLSHQGIISAMEDADRAKFDDSADSIKNDVLEDLARAAVHCRELIDELTGDFDSRLSS